MRTLFTLLILLAVVRPCSGQSADFLFGQPHGMVAFRTGWMMPRAKSDLFTSVQDLLTVDRKDFKAPAVGLDLDIAITPRATAVAGFDFSGSTTNSEYRHFVDNNRLPINQTTELREANFSGSIKMALTPRGRDVSQHAWIPSLLTPYVGAGVGLMRYRFTQHGDFVEIKDLSVFSHTYNSQGWSPSAHVFGGIDVKAWKRLYFSGEARYLWSHTDLGSDSDFPKFTIDLAGLRATGGIRYMF